MNRNAPYYVDTKVRQRGAQTFAVDPNITNEGVVPPVPGSIINYPYKLPFLAHSFPVRSIRVYPADAINGSGDFANPNNVLLTMRRADGVYLMRDIPAATFADRMADASMRPLLLRSDFYPDPAQCFARWTRANQIGVLYVTFNYG